MLVYHVNLLQVFQLFQFSFFQIKSANHCEGYVNFQDIEHQLDNIKSSWYSGVVAKALDSQSMGPVLKTTG